VGAELLRGEAFIDYYRYSEVRGCAVGESKFAAVVSLPSKPPRFLDLGPAAPIEKAVRTWENEQAAGSNRGAAFGELKRRIWSPALSYIGPGPASVWVSPDGVLNRVPWNAAAVGSNKQIAVLNSAQQLRNLRRAAKTSLPSHPKVLLAGPFDYGPVDDAFGRGFTAIPEDQSEAGVTRGLWEKSGAVVRQCHSNDERSCVNSGMPGSDIVHFSTHAIFSGRDDSLNASGLALHAANLGDAGMLKAADILKLDLRSAKLITLAACSTARGDVIDGQGVIGLQAAFIAAGARAILMSLAPVSYPDARKFIPEFYKNLLSGNGKIAAAQALRQTQEHFAKSGDPVAWMPWILAGEGW
jgi:CHAT domain-containing protein